ncbi:MAG: hypothetical protein K8S54_21050 [Spirochaetia bacterium]|nr:hypothetical protein [Spirochaetia bacterium]
MKPFKKLSLAVVLMSLILQQACNDKKDDITPIALLALAGAPSSSATQGPLPQPALDTAIMVLNGTNLVLTNRFSCTTGTTGIGFAMVDTDNLPTLFIHNINFALQSGISVGPGGSVLDIDVPGGLLNPSQNCKASIRENTTTVYDLEVTSCPMQGTLGNPNPAAASVSFRVRCAK